MKAFFQRIAYSLVSFSWIERSVMVYFRVDGYMIGRPGQCSLTSTYSFVTDDLWIYQENHDKLGMVSDIPVQVGMFTEVMCAWGTLKEVN